MKIKFALIIFVSYCFGEYLPNRALIDENHIFVLISTDKYDKQFVSDFEITDLLKSNFPQGPLRYNRVLEKAEITDLKVQEIENNSWQLQVLCVGDSEGSSKVKCGFESLDRHQHLAYVFSLSSEIKEIKGFIILRSLYKAIINNTEFKRSITLDAKTGQNLLYEEDEFWDEEPPAAMREDPKNFLDKVIVELSKFSMVRKSALWMIMKYVSVKSYLKKYV